MRSHFWVFFNSLILVSSIGLAEETMGEKFNPQPTHTTNVPIKISDYFVSQSFPLTLAKDGFEGQIELLLDKRFKDQDVYDATGMAFADPDDGVEKKSLDIKSVKPGVLRLVSKEGRITDQMVWKWEFVSLELKSRLDLYGDGRPVFRLDKDTSYIRYPRVNTDFIGIKNGRLYTCFTLSSEHTQSLQMDQDWKMVPARTGNGKNFLSIKSQGPIADAQMEDRDFYLTRYFFDGKKWRKKTKKVRWVKEWEKYKEAFPPETEFP